MLTPGIGPATEGLRGFSLFFASHPPVITASTVTTNKVVTESTNLVINACRCEGSIANDYYRRTC